VSDEAVPVATPGEAEGAARLAEALEGRAGAAAAFDDALSAARFLQAVGRAASDDDVAARRLRRRLVARASWRRALLRAGAAAAVLLAATLATRLRHAEPPTADILAQREFAAERAVARARTARGDSLDAGVAVFDALLRERAAASSAPSASEPDSAVPAPTPTAGGPT
jgi:hypothetical protein